MALLNYYKLKIQWCKVKNIFKTAQRLSAALPVFCGEYLLAMMNQGKRYSTRAQLHKIPS